MGTVSTSSAARSMGAGQPTTDGVDIDGALTQCLDAPDKQSTGDQDACIVEATHAWDARLNANYRALQAELPEASRPILLAAQRAWLASRDADLKLIAAVYATVRGTMYAPMNANDVMMLTKRRAQTLTRYAADLSYAASGEFRPITAKAVGSSDIDAVARRMTRRLPAASGNTVRVSNEKWRAFMTAETALIAVVCPQGNAAAGQACRVAQARAASAARLEWLTGLDRLIGAN
ncbi:lysozyme inhibitor LprI family protein [Pandoraea captiosa]|nr:lysozyme inhibitor LprI family protein [Pandoraea captiosa]